MMISGNAKIEGLLPSLHMDGVQYNVALSIFFIPYVLAGLIPPVRLPLRSKTYTLQRCRATWC